MSKKSLVVKVGLAVVGLGYAAFWEFLNASALTDFFGLSPAWNTRVGVSIAAIGIALAFWEEQSKIAELQDKLDDRKRIREAKLTLTHLAQEGKREDFGGGDDFLPGAIRWRDRAEKFVREALSETAAREFRASTSRHGSPDLDNLGPEYKTVDGKDDVRVIRMRVEEHCSVLLKLAERLKPEDVNPNWSPEQEKSEP